MLPISATLNSLVVDMESYFKMPIFWGRGLTRQHGGRTLGVLPALFSHPLVIRSLRCLKTAQFPLLHPQCWPLTLLTRRRPPEVPRGRRYLQRGGRPFGTRWRPRSHPINLPRPLAAPGGRPAREVAFRTSDSVCCSPARVAGSPQTPHWSGFSSLAGPPTPEPDRLLGMAGLLVVGPWAAGDFVCLGAAGGPLLPT